MDPYLAPKWRRNQVNQALWEYLVRFEHWGNPPQGMSDETLSQVPTVFGSKIRKLLNLDRSLTLDGEMMTPAASWVFFEAANEGTGSEELHGDFHVFMLGIALDLWQLAGWKQSEVIYFLRHTKKQFLSAYTKIRKENITTGVSSGTRADASNTESGCYVVIRRSFSELFPEIQDGDNSAILLKPDFLYGLPQLMELYANHPNTQRTCIILEISDMAHAEPGRLTAVEPVGRGRPKAS